MHSEIKTSYIIAILYISPHKIFKAFIKNKVQFFEILLTPDIGLYKLPVLYPSSNDTLPPFSLHAITESSPFIGIYIHHLQGNRQHVALKTHHPNAINKIRYNTCTFIINII